MNTADLIELTNFGAAFERLLACNQRFLDGLLTAPNSASTNLALQVDQHSITLDAFGHLAAARFRPISSNSELAGEYVFRASKESEESIEVSRFYLQSADAGARGGVFRDAEMQDRVCDASNSRIADYICFEIARGMRAKLFGPLPRQ